MGSSREFHGPVVLGVSLIFLSACGFLPTREPLPTLFVLDTPAATDEDLASSDSGQPTLPATWTPAADLSLPAAATAEGQTASQPQATPQPASGGYSPVTTTDLGNGWMLYEIAFSNYSISLPQDWAYVDIRPEMWETSSATLAEIVPEGASFVEDSLPSFFAYGVDFIAYAETAHSGSRDFYSNVILFSEFTGQFVSLSDLTDQDLDAIALLFGTDTLTHGRVSLPGGEAVRMEYTASAISNTGELVNTGGIGYVLVEDNYLYIIELTTTSDQLNTFRSTFEQVAESFRVLN